MQLFCLGVLHVFLFHHSKKNKFCSSKVLVVTVISTPTTLAGKTARQFLPDDFDAAADNPEFPIEFGNALVWGLTAELCSEYGLPEREQGRIWSVAENKLEILLDYDSENASVEFALDYRQ